MRPRDSTSGLCVNMFEFVWPDGCEITLLHVFSLVFQHKVVIYWLMHALSFCLPNLQGRFNDSSFFPNNDCKKCFLALYIDELVQEKRYSIANALELRLSCTNPSISWIWCWAIMGFVIRVPLCAGNIYECRVWFEVTPRVFNMKDGFKHCEALANVYCFNSHTPEQMCHIWMILYWQ